MANAVGLILDLSSFCDLELTDVCSPPFDDIVTLYSPRDRVRLESRAILLFLLQSRKSSPPNNRDVKCNSFALG